MFLIHSFVIGWEAQACLGLCTDKATPPFSAFHSSRLALLTELWEPSPVLTLREIELIRKSRLWYCPGRNLVDNFWTNLHRNVHFSKTNAVRIWACPVIAYTQSQKKHTINSLASPGTQGQGQVTPAGSYFITKFIYLHSSAKEMQLSMVCFFWDEYRNK